MTEEIVKLAISEWEAVLGQKNVLYDDASINRYSRSTLPQGTTPAAILRPGSVEDIQSILKTATKYSINIYPISRGKNWGYGDACAVGDGQAIIDLGRMNRIVEIDPVLAYAVIEPGVTQLQLHKYLKENKIPLWFDCTGAGPEASVFGNTLERGFGHTPYGDHLLNTCGMEVVLSDGRVLKTGFGHYSNAKAANVFRWGIGPYLDGLFTQSNFGIVTKLGIWLMPEPRCFNAFFFSVPEEKDIFSVVEALRPLRLQGTVRSLVHIANDLRVISSFQHYPWELTNGATPLPEELRKKLRRRGNFGAWNVTGALYGSKGQVASARNEISNALRSLAKVKFINDTKLTIAKKIGDFCQFLGIAGEFVGMLRSLESVYNLLKGVPTEAFFHGTLWRTKEINTTVSSDPLDNNAGLMWLSPVLPMTGAAALELNDIVTPIFKEYDFEPLITITLITERAMACVMTISYNRQDPIETEKATLCYDKLFDAIMKAGYIPYRIGIQSMNKLAKGSSVFWDVVDEIKRTLDQHQIIAKGRYQPKSRRH
ncbi:MAG: FAD-binding oxidoreductase [Nitrospirae bacterium]|nr:FAD-binding oxidoreductase [Nitrospirota bacterium]